MVTVTTFMAWIQLSVLTRHPEFAEEILLAQGALSVSFLDAADDPVLEPAPGETPLWPRTRTVGLFAEGTDPAPVIGALRELLPDGDAAVATTAALADEEWTRIWLRDWQPLKFGARLWVCPREKVVQEDGAVTVLLDPGLAFGTGTHPTTALCLEWLAGAELAGKSVLDYGCGSGLLGIAALKLGAARAVAVDIDPQALTATRDNAAQNGVAPQLDVYEPGALPAGTFDVVLANILAQPLVALAPALTARLKPGGALVLAGLLERHEEEVGTAYRAAIRLDKPLRREGWTRLSGRRI